MKKSIFIIILLIFTQACKKEEPMAEAPKISFTGKWERTFEAGPGNLHTVSYIVYQDSIRYTLQGPIGTANYLIFKDKFFTENNRFIGHTKDEDYYVLFVKQNTSNKISLYKQKVLSVAEGEAINLPADTSTQNHGWNSYVKK